LQLISNEVSWFSWREREREREDGRVRGTEHGNQRSFHASPLQILEG